MIWMESYSEYSQSTGTPLHFMQGDETRNALCLPLTPEQTALRQARSPDDKSAKLGWVCFVDVRLVLNHHLLPALWALSHK